MASTLLLALLLSFFHYTQSFSTPDGCSHRLDDRGRHLVLCAQGGLSGPLDITRLDTRTEVLKFTAPQDNRNALIIGPIFSNLQKLQELYIIHCDIPEIGPNSFWRLPKLELLSLRDNNISTLLDLNFNGLPGLKKLDLSENRIEHMASGTFRYLTALTALSLARNKLHDLMTRVFERLSKLQELNLSGNKLRELNPEVFVDIKELKVLECRDCGLVTLNPSVLDRIPHLATLDLGNNALQELTSEHLASLSDLTALWLDGNRLHHIEACLFASLPTLKKLNLSRNKLHHLPVDLFGNKTSISELNVGYNKLTELQPFGNTLRSLDLSGNHMLMVEDLGLVFKESRYLQRLSLSDMKLHDGNLPLGLFDFNYELNFLNLSYNRLTVFPIGLLSPTPRLDEIDLHGNRLRGLDGNALLRIDQISSVRLTKNPWSCDLCNIGPVLTVMNRSQILQDIVCYSPRSLRNKKLSSLKIPNLANCGNRELLYEDDLDEEGLGLVAAGAGLLLIILTLIALLAAVYYTRRHHADYYTHEESRTDHDPMFDNNDMNYTDHGEINFKFPADTKISVATIDEISKNDPDIRR